VVDLAGNTGTLSRNAARVLEDDLTIEFLCNVTGNAVVDRHDAMELRWLQVVENGELVEKPGYNFFAFEINMNLLATSSGASGMQVQDRITCNNEEYVILDYASDLLIVTSEVHIFDILGNLAAEPVSNPSLRVSYDTKTIRKLLHMDSLSCNTLNAYLESGKYGLSHATLSSDPDTLVALYPGRLNLGYDLMKEAKDRNDTAHVVPVWNCLNYKGRLVAPGGYIASQTITAVGDKRYVTIKFIVTSREQVGL
jgi:hypothetical protein